jgi:hypothetical protein
MTAKHRGDAKNDRKRHGGDEHKAFHNVSLTPCSALVQSQRCLDCFARMQNSASFGFFEIISFALEDGMFSPGTCRFRATAETSGHC